MSSCGAATPGPGVHPHEDYNRYVDGKPRADGVRDFLACRAITLTEGVAWRTLPTRRRCRRPAARKNELLLQDARRAWCGGDPGSVRYLNAVNEAGLATAVVTSSANGEQVIAAGGFADLIERGSTAWSRSGTACTASLRRTPSWPAPGAGRRAGEAVVFEDALAGVAAGRAGSFGYVVGVDRGDQADELRAHGADVVVKDLARAPGWGPGP